MTTRVIAALSVLALVLIVMAGSAVYAGTMMNMQGNDGNHGMSEEQCENMTNRMTIEQCESIMGTSHDANHRNMMTSDHVTGMHGAGNSTGGCH